MRNEHIVKYGVVIAALSLAGIVAFYPRGLSGFIEDANNLIQGKSASRSCGTWAHPTRQSLLSSPFDAPKNTR